MGVSATNKFAEKPAAKAKQAKPKGMGAPEASRNPMPEIGHSRFRLTEVEEGFNAGTNKSSLKIKVSALDLDGSPHSEGDDFTLVFMRTVPGERDYKLAIVGFAGYDDLGEYTAFDPNGELFTAAIGEENDYTAEAADLIGRVCDVKVSRGGDVKDRETGVPNGDFYRAYKWTAVHDEELNASQRIEK